MKPFRSSLLRYAQERGGLVVASDTPHEANSTGHNGATDVLIQGAPGYCAVLTLVSHSVVTIEDRGLGDDAETCVGALAVLDVMLNAT